MEDIKQYLPDFPSGPLDDYRKRASFDWRKMKCMLEGEDVVKFQIKVWKTLEADPLFQRSLTEERNWQEEHHVNFQRSMRLAEYDFLPSELLLSKPYFLSVFTNAIAMYDLSLAAKVSLSNPYFFLAIRSNGNSKHLKLFDPLQKREISGCFALTEIGHGTNTKGMQTTSTFDPETQEFILHSPNFQASKAWAGNIGQIATHAVVFAQLYTPDGVCHGLHSFVVPIRDPRTLLPYRGVTVGDLGPKIGLNGVDNGFVIFDSYRIPYDSLLNKNGDVTPDGRYLSALQSGNKRAGASMGMLSAGRVGISANCINFMRISITISVRYSALRHQFGPTPDKELPVLEYQIQQYRLLPFVAATYVYHYFAKDFMKEYFDLSMTSNLDGKSSEIMEHSAYIHALSCCAKAVCSWTARDCIQESREACGGFGYLQAAGFGRLRNDNDASSTYEGVNNVILQQTSNYLLNLMKRRDIGQDLPDKIPDLTFLKNIDFILETKFPPLHENNTICIPVLLDMYYWLVSYLLKQCVSKLQTELIKNKNAFFAYSNSQAYYCHTLSIVFFQLVALKRFSVFINEVSEPSLKHILDILGRLYGLWSIEKHLGTLYAGGYFSGSSPNFIIKENILKLCSELKDDAVALVDVLSPTDFILHSALGKSDGQVYENVRKAIMNNPGAMDRPYWWQEFLKKPSVALIKPKL